MKYIYYKSNLGIILSFSVFPIGFCIINALSHLNSMGWYYACIILEFVILYTTGYGCFFDEDHFEIIYYFRFFRRKKTIYYNSIKKISYFVNPYKSLPEIEFFLETKPLPMFLSCISLKKALVILRIINNKSIDIEINCSNNKKREIIEKELYNNVSVNLCNNQ